MPRRTVPAPSWYWHRLSAMTPMEMTLHARKKLRQIADVHRPWPLPALNLEPAVPFPKLPQPDAAPAALREALGRDLETILAGRWKLFETIELTVDDPPHWHREYAAGRDLAITESAFGLDHRDLPPGADIKVIWELSRWSQLVRLGMAAYVLDSQPARNKCIAWLQDWVEHNPPYRGWNWTSALEAGIRLIQFTWLDELFSACKRRNDTRWPADNVDPTLDSLRQLLLPAHVRYAWRYRSFGSSANNHLLGELTGCIVATVRWPELTRVATTLDELQACWEGEVLKQFAPDGGNREQALNYHLFSFELSWQALKALEAAHRDIASSVRDRLGLAAAYYRDVQVSDDPWDYGDSDDAHVTPFFVRNAVQEWHAWTGTTASGTGVGYWLGDPPSPPPGHARPTLETGPWRFFPESGIAICDASPWLLRWDLSPLGYLTTAAHGHWDALHLSVWYGGVALVIDPGTGAYYADAELRSWLASAAAHNGPRPSGMAQPARLGPFLWAAHHPNPTFTVDASRAIGLLSLPGAHLRRRVASTSRSLGWEVEDGCFDGRGEARSFTVCWQFAPGSQVQTLGPREFLVKRLGVAVRVSVSGDWDVVELIAPRADANASSSKNARARPLQGIVSPAFRAVARAPLLKLSGQPSPNTPGNFRTAFCETER